MTDSEVKLCKIAPKDWPQLRDKYLIDWPKNFLGYYTVDNFIRWIEKEPGIRHLDFYCLNGDWSDGTFAAVDRYQLFLNSLNESNERLTTVLSLLDWNRGFKCSTFLARHRSAVIDVVKSKNLKKEYDSTTDLLYLPKEEAIEQNVVIPEGYTLGPLTEVDAEKADRVWPNRHVGSKFFLKRLAAYNPNVGLYSPNGELTAWSFRLQAGVLGALQVDENYLKRGFGTVVLKAITKQLAEIGHDSCACVNVDNEPSQALFKKAGFRKVDTAFWLRTFPEVPFEWSDD